MAHLAAAMVWIGVAALADKRGERYLFSWRDSETYWQQASRVSRR